MCQHKVYLFQTCGHAVISQPAISVCADYQSEHGHEMTAKRRASNCSISSVYSADEPETTTASTASTATTTSTTTSHTQCPNITSHPLHTLRLHTLCAVCTSSRSERLDFFEKEQLRGFEEGVKARKRQWWEETRRVVRRKISSLSERSGSSEDGHRSLRLERGNCENQPATAATTATITADGDEPPRPSTPPPRPPRPHSTDYQLSQNVYRPPFVRHVPPSPALSPDPNASTFSHPTHHTSSFQPSFSTSYSSQPIASTPTPAQTPKRNNHAHSSSNQSFNYNYNPPPTPAYSVFSSITSSSTTDSLSPPLSPLMTDSRKSWLSGDIRIRGSGRRSAVFGSESSFDGFEIPEQIREEDCDSEGDGSGGERVGRRFGGSECGDVLGAGKVRVRIGGRRSAGDAEEGARRGAIDCVERWKRQRERFQIEDGFF